MLKTVVLLFSIVASIDCGVVWQSNIKREVLKEIIETLVDITEKHINTAGCKDPMVMDVFRSNAVHSAPEAFCKANKTLQSITPCPTMRNSMEKLHMNLQKAGEEATSCVIENSLTDLNDFLVKLLKFSRSIFSKT